MNDFKIAVEMLDVMERIELYACIGEFEISIHTDAEFDAEVFRPNVWKVFEMYLKVSERV